MVLKHIEGDISLKEKYLSFEKEKRIRRMQFFERMLIPGILLYIFLWLPAYIAGVLFSPENILQTTFYFGIVMNIVYLIVIFKYYPYIIKKRAQDFGKEGKIETIILLSGAVLSTLIGIYILYLTSNMNIEGIMAFSKYNKFIRIPEVIVSITWLWLLFRPGSKGKNTYGEEEYYKLKFLG